MSFTMKYDKNGRPIPSASNYKEEQIAAEPIKVEPVQEPVAQIEVAPEPSIEQPKPNEEVQQQEAQTQSVQADETAAEKNFRVLRDKAARAERDRDELIRLLKAQQQPQQQVQAVEENYDINLAPDDLAEGKHLSKIEKKYKKLEQDMQQFKQQANEKIIETRLKTEFPDFDRVVSPENIEVFRTAFPEIAQTLSTSNDLYNKAVTAYTLIKKLGISNEAQIELERNRVQQNMAKPKPVSSIQPQKSTTPLEQANPFAQGLTKDLRDQLRREMEQSRKAR